MLTRGGYDQEAYKFEANLMIRCVKYLKTTN